MLCGLTDRFKVSMKTNQQLIILGKIWSSGMTSHPYIYTRCPVKSINVSSTVERSPLFNLDRNLYV